MQGTLVRYGPGASNLAFISAPRPPPRPAAAPAAPTHQPRSVTHMDRFLVLLGGLTDGLMFAPYVEPLAVATAQMGWTLVQGQRRARGQYGAGTEALLPIRGVVLQAPVSDREWLGMYPGELEPIAISARAMEASGKGAEIVARLGLVGGAPVTASRFVALYDKGGDDDMFSCDLTDEELRAHLAPVGATCPCLVLASGVDEAAPPGTDIASQAQRIESAVSAGGAGARCVVVAGAPHNLAGFEEQGVAAVCDFLTGL